MFCVQNISNAPNVTNQLGNDENLPIENMR